ncbi:hypothetical protein BTUL_0075g00090 [Botrytis tulipae]|uniref:Uncharacterized protein n=1 Tax=Botrytis tulipae TaxID=87230 RepID=A0A4Z1EL61_9HELO|nr:hypothetical protein BTUL_0075g00090 [Botrytis tulipae]
MVLPTERDRELWRKAIQTPEQITDEERRNILGLVDPTTQLSNCLEITRMSPDEFEKKVLQNPESLTMDECRLIQYGYHIWDNSQALAASKMTWPLEDQLANIDAEVAIITPHEDAILTAASLRASSLGKLRNEAMKASIKKAADGGGKPCAWVERLIDRSVPLTAINLQPSWGFVIFRDARTNCSKEAWEKFRKSFENALRTGISLLVGGEQINQTRKLVWQDESVDENDSESIYRAFQDVVKAKTVSDQQILQNKFLLVTPEVIASFKGSSTTPWIWAYDTNFDLKVSSEKDNSTSFDGRLRVAANSAFTWFYAARKEEIYCMKQFWEYAQKKPDQVWDVATEMGRYHGPLVLLKKGTHWSFNTYEFRS